MKKFFLSVLPLVTVACLFGSSKLIRPDAQIATVDGRIISYAAYDSAYKSLEDKVEPEVTQDSLKSQTLDSLIIAKLIDIRMDSIKAALDNDWDFSHKRIDDNTQTIFKVLFDKQVTAKAFLAVADTARVVKYYEDHKSNYVEPEQVKALQILIARPKPDTIGVKSEKKRNKAIKEADSFAKKRADAVMKLAVAGDNWDSLVTAYSEDKKTTGKGGDMGSFGRGRFTPQFDTLVFGAQPGTIVGPIDSKLGYQIIKVVEHTPEIQKPLNAEVTNTIHGDIIREEENNISKAYLDSLKKEAEYVYNDSLIALNDSLVNPRAWILIINKTDTVYQKVVSENLPRFIRWKRKPADSLTVDDKKEMLYMLSTTYILRNSARKLGYLDNTEVKNALNEYTTTEAKLRLAGILNDQEYQPSDSEEVAYFNSHQDKYTVDRKLTVYHIIFSDSILAEAVRDSLVKGADFKEMAKRYYPGDPEIREVAYNLGQIGPKDMGDEFYSVADTMKVGSISHAVKTAWGYHLIKLVERKQDKTLDQVRPGIRQVLKDQRDAAKKNMIVAEWRKEALIKVNSNLVAKYKPIEKKVIEIEPTASKQSGGK